MHITRSLPVAALLAGVCAAVLSTGCSRQSEQPEQPTLTFHEYTVRGEVVQPVAAEDGEGLRIRHEAIPDYVGPGGKLGMNVMVMPFWPPVGATPQDLDTAAIEQSLVTLKPGDKVQVTFRVWLEEDTFRPRGYWATSATLLPPDTVLDWTPLAGPDSAN